MWSPSEAVGREVERRYGLRVLPDRAAALEADLARLAGAWHLTPAAAALRVIREPDSLALLLPAVTVGETHFLRDTSQMRALKSEVLPALAAACLAGGTPLRIWSAGCATGEEPYSLAILLEELRREGEEVPRAQIVGTDINADALARARAGLYGAWSFRGVSASVRDRYFRTAGGGYQAVPALRLAVEFAEHNLVSDTLPPAVFGGSPVHLIVCRNVLLYLLPPAARGVVARFAAALAPGGVLVTGYAEQGRDVYAAFEPRGTQSTLLRRPAA